ncbi:hypothetical protein ACFL0L_01055 [Patescibacteria group bacterium]
MTILKGLKMIDRAKLPHPEWEFVRGSKDLKKFPKIKDYVGWTIRTIDIKGGKWRNLYVNWLPKKQVPEKIDEFKKKLKGRATFIVYPSWKWKKGGTILIEKDRIVIEVVKGAIVDLMRHGKIDASYFYEHGKLISYTGDKKVLTPAERKKVLLAPKKLSQKDVILEWGITTQNKFIFYRIENIREAAKLLLKKYS